MKQITRNIDFDSARDLLERVPRACLSFAHDQRPQAQPVRLLWRDEHYWVGLPAKANSLPESGQEVVLLVDEGIYFYDLRAIYMRGVIQHVPLPEMLPAVCTWFELTPHKIVAWDYGTLHEVDDGHA